MVIFKTLKMTNWLVGLFWAKKCLQINAAPQLAYNLLKMTVHLVKRMKSQNIFSWSSHSFPRTQDLSKIANHSDVLNNSDMIQFILPEASLVKELFSQQFAKDFSRDVDPQQYTNQ